MSNNKQSSIELFIEQLEEKGGAWENVSIRRLNISIDVSDYMELKQEAKAKYEHEMCVFADEYASYILDQSKLGIKGAMVSMCAWTFFKNRRNEQQ